MAKYLDDPPLSIFTNGVDEQALQIELVPLDPHVIRTTELDTYESSIDFVFPGGLIGGSFVVWRAHACFSLTVKVCRVRGAGQPTNRPTTRAV
ncbi:MAG: hypothetical protein IIB12_03075 [Chloroflexi bacterium]|nr:hypothetical protein [Chloroflexota bacterium]